MHTFPTNNHGNSKPGSLRTGIAELEAIAGRAAALKIITACGGREILVRAIPHAEDELTQIVGLETAQAIADELLGDDEGGRNLFIHQPSYQTFLPGDAVQPVHGALPSPRDVALPGRLGEIEALCGRDVALKVAAEYGGRRMYIPNEMTPESPLAKLVGFEAALAIADRFEESGLTVDIPPAVYGSTQVRRDIGMQMLRDGYSRGHVIQTLKVSRSQAAVWVKKVKEEQK